MKRRSIGVFWIGVLLGSLFVISSPAQEKKKKIHVNVGVDFGYGKVAQSSDSTSPSMGFTTIGATLAYRLGRVVALGTSLDYKFITQFSDVVASVGNRRGSDLSVFAPTVILDFNSVKLKLAYHLMDEYKLQNVSLSGAYPIYRGGSGIHAKLAIALKKTKKLHLALSLSQYSFSQQDISGNVTTLSNPLTLQEFAIGVLYVF
jgi:hypothetical protein